MRQLLVKIPPKPALLALVLALTCVVYAPGLSGGFALDDYTNIVQNEALKPADISWHSVSQAMFSFQAGPTMRPVSMLTFALNAYFTGNDEAAAFKITNLIIHLLNGLMVFWLLSQLAGIYRKLYAQDIPTERLQWLAYAAGAAWMLHPLNAMPVLYVVQREAALSSFFVLAGVNAYIWARGRQSVGSGGGLVLWAGVPCLTALAILSKESGALLPVYALAVEAFIFRFRGNGGVTNKGVILFFALVLLFPGLLGLSWALFGHGGGALNYSGRDFDMRERLLTETRVIWLYVRWTLFPTPASLGLYHDDIALSRGLLTPVTTLFAALGIAGLVTVCLLVHRRLPLVALGIAWFLGGQLMESSIFPLELAYEHRCYLPDLGLLLAASSLLFPVRAAARGRTIRYTVFALAIAACAALTWMRAYDWRDNLSFAAAEARHHPQSPYATYMLGQTYANLALMTDAGQYDNAVSSLRAASAVANSTIIPDVSLVLVEAQLKGKVDADVLPRIALKIGERKISASDIQGLSALGDCVNRGNCRLPTTDMQAIFDSALANHHLDMQHDSKANILVIYGNYVSAHDAHDMAKARALMAQAASLVPAEPQYRMNLVTMDINLRDRALAERDLDALRRLNYLGHLDGQITQYEERIRELPAGDR